MVQIARSQAEQAPLGAHSRLGSWAILLGVVLLGGALLLYLIDRYLPNLLISVWWALWTSLRWKDSLRQRPGRFLYGATIALALLAAVTLAALPFYANGIHLRPESHIRQSMVDVKYQAPFVWESCGGPLLELAKFFHLFTPLIVVLTAPFFFRSVRLEWRTMLQAERVWWILVLGAATLAYAVSLKDWAIILVWLLD